MLSFQRVPSKWWMVPTVLTVQISLGLVPWIPV